MANLNNAPQFPSQSENRPFEAIYEEFLPRIYNFFLYRFGDPALAEDLTAVTFEKAWKKRGKFRQELASLSTWLFTIARNTAVDAYRQNHRAAEDIESAAQADDGLQQGEQRLKDQLKYVREGLGSLNLANPQSWEEIKMRLASGYNSDVRNLFNRFTPRQDGDSA